MKKLILYIKAWLPKLKAVTQESVQDPEIVIAVATPTKTRFGVFCKIVYIIGQIFDNFKKKTQ